MLKALLILVPIVIFGCSSGEITPKGEMLGTVDSKTNLGDPSAEIYMASWLPKETRKAVVEDLMEKVRNKELEVFEVYPSEKPNEMIPMSDSAMQYEFFHVDTEYIVGDDGYMKPLPIEEGFDAGAIVYLKFKEELYYDKTTGEFEKRVTHVCPMEQIYNEDGSRRGDRGLFWVKLK